MSRALDLIPCAGSCGVEFAPFKLRQTIALAMSEFGETPITGILPDKLGILEEYAVRFFLPSGV